MYSFICKLFIKDYQNTSDSNVREKYGTVFSIFAIVCNIILVTFKLIISFITNSISIRADAFNNMSDVGSNIATLFGFKLSNQHPDRDHPYGHGRYEYISGMIIAFLILLVAFTSIKDAIFKIIKPEELNTSNIAFVILAFSIGIKIIMGYVNKKAGKDITSETLLAAGQDGYNDALTTSATLVSLLISRLFNVNVDAYIGLIVSLIILKAGVGVFIDQVSTILGKAPDKELIRDIEKYILDNSEVIGIHDLLMHDYGPSKQFMTLHCEVDSRKDVLDLHDMIDNLEVNIMKKYGIMTTIHMDPVVLNNKEVNNAKAKVKKIVSSINSEYSIHDFRMVIGDSHSNLIFDVVLPSDDRTAHHEIEEKISKLVKEYNPKYNCVITVEHSYVNL